jgi:glycosyltransferase involved in cell wall biosynthesis
MLTHEQRQQMGERARQRALNLFTQKQCIQTYLNTYQELIRQSRIIELKSFGKI